MAHRHDVWAVAKATGAEDAAAEAAMAAAIENALRRLAAGADTPEGRAALAAGGTAALLNVLDFDQLGVDLNEVLQSPLAGIYLSKAFRSMFDLVPITAALDFEALEPRAIQFATAQAGQRVVQVSAEIRAQVKSITLQGLIEGATRNERAKLIEAIIPLHDRFAQAVINTHARTFAAAMEAGKSAGEAQAAADTAAAAHSKRLTKVRAQAIARTEVMTATNTGRFEGWAAEISAGNFSKDSRKEWVPGDNPCDICDPMTGEIVMWDQPFSAGKMMPPQHVCCRCTAVLLPPDVELRAGDASRRPAPAPRTVSNPDKPRPKKAPANPKPKPGAEWTPTKVEPVRSPAPAAAAPAAAAPAASTATAPAAATAAPAAAKPAAQPKGKKLSAGDLSIEQGTAIARSSMDAAAGRKTQAEHRAYVRGITGTDSKGYTTGKGPTIDLAESTEITVTGSGRTV